MAEGKDLQDKIDAFLTGQLNEQELEAFQQAMEKDPDLQKEVRLQESFMQGAITLGNQELKGKLQEIHTKVIGGEQNDTSIQKRPMLRTLAIILGVVGVALLIYFLFFTKPSPEKVYADFFVPFPVAEMTRDSDARQEWIEAGSFYNQQNYQEALPRLEGLVQSNPDNQELKLALGVSYLESNQLQQAEATFTQVLTNNNALFTDQAQWYLALTALKRKDIELTRNYLQPLLDSSTADHHNDAQRLSRSLDKLD